MHIFLVLNHQRIGGLSSVGPSWPSCADTWACPF
uniref:Uncharacterized protein n=1 Tax=Arundo donax TaxID=35708 RepID=A0A0A9BW35_ARUDO